MGASIQRRTEFDCVTILVSLRTIVKIYDHVERINSS